MAERQLIVKIDGPAIHDSVIPFRLLANILNGIQETFYYIGLAELGKDIRVRTRIPPEIQEACELRRVAEKAGSYEIVAEVANPMQLKLPFPGDYDLGLKVRKNYLALLEKLPAIKKHEDLRDLFPDSRYRKRILRSLDSYCPRKGDGWTLKIGTKQDAPYFPLTPESRNMIVRALQEPQVENLTVTGELVRLHLDENRLGIYYEPTHKVLDCFYDEELEDFVINNLRGLIQVTGQVQLDEDGEPAKIVHVSEIQELDLSPLQLAQVSTPKVTLQAIRPMEVVPIFENQEVIIEMPQFGIIATGATREEAIEALQDDLAWLWLEYACAPDDQLSADARNLKNELKELFKEE